MKPKEQLALSFPTKKKKLALVLSGGSARGLAHIGVLEVLDENKIPIDAIVGTSMGAVIGGIYAAGKIKEFKEEIVKLSHSKMRSMIWNLKFKRFDSDSTKTFGPTLSKYLKNKKFEDLAINFTAIATDLNSGQEVYINKGNMVKGILASVCLPGICHPIEMGKRMLVDGGIVDPLPQGYGKLIAEKVISVNAMPKKYVYKKDKSGVLEVLMGAAGIMTNTIVNMEKSFNLNYPEKKNKIVYIQLDTKNRDPFDFSNIEKLIKIGRVAAKKHIKEIIELAREK